jgi:hypothetical protein
MNYDGLTFDRRELVSVMSSYYDDIINFITQPAFQAIFAEMMSLPPTARPRFVHEVWLEPEVLAARGLEVPQGILIQTSAFGDRRPTLFVVKKLLPEKYHVAWENVNWTFNNDFKEEDVPSDSESSWRFPLPVATQNTLLEQGIDLQSAPDASPMFAQRLDTDELSLSTKVAG